MTIAVMVPVVCMGGVAVLISTAVTWTLSMVVAACLTAEGCDGPKADGQAVDDAMAVVDDKVTQQQQPPPWWRPQNMCVYGRFIFDVLGYLTNAARACRSVVVPALQRHHKLLVAWLVGISCIRLAVHFLIMFSCLPASLWFRSTAMYFVYDIWSYSVYVLRKRFSNPAIVWGLGMVALAYDATFAQVDMHRSYISNIVDMLYKIEQESAALERAATTLLRWIRTVLVAVKP